MIALIDYGSGNIRSVTKALQHEGADVQLVSDAARLPEAEAVVLPGVGDFRRLRAQYQGAQPLGSAAGLAWEREAVSWDLRGVSTAVRFERGIAGRAGVRFFSGAGEEVSILRSEGAADRLEQPPAYPAAHPLWRSLPPEPYVFFVHSYYPASRRDDVVISQTTYGETFASGAALGNVAGVQFHRRKARMSASRC